MWDRGGGKPHSRFTVHYIIRRHPSSFGMCQKYRIRILWRFYVSAVLTVMFYALLFYSRQEPPTLVYIYNKTWMNWTLSPKKTTYINGKTIKSIAILLIFQPEEFRFDFTHIHGFVLDLDKDYQNSSYRKFLKDNEITFMNIRL
jgi:hypothetical protein